MIFLSIFDSLSFFKMFLRAKKAALAFSFSLVGIMSFNKLIDFRLPERLFGLRRSGLS